MNQLAHLEALIVAAEKARTAAARGDLFVSIEGVRLVNAMHDLTEVDALYDLADDIAVQIDEPREAPLGRIYATITRARADALDRPLSADWIGAAIADKYVKQMQFQMACTGRQWCDFVSYDPRFGVDMQLHVRRVERDEALIAEIEEAVSAFLAEVDAKVDALTNLYRKAA